MNADMRDQTGVMTECTKIKQPDQECDFYEKGSWSDKCMFLRFDQFCSFLEQIDDK